MVTNVITSGDFIGQPLLINADFCTVGKTFRNEGERFKINDYYLINIVMKKDKSSSAIFGTYVAQALGAVAFPKLLFECCTVSLKYGDGYESTVNISRESYNALSSSVERHNKDMFVKLKVEK